MIVDQFATHPAYPFSRYFEDTNQFIAAQQYWIAILRVSAGWIEDEWVPLPSDPSSSQQQQFDGEILLLRSVRQPKQVVLNVTSVEGTVASLMHYNTSIGVEEMARWGGDAVAVPAMTEADARAQTSEIYRPVRAWVDPATYWSPNGSHPDGGKEVAVERLILIAEVSALAERRARHALELFLGLGPARDRVDRIFSSDDP